jgi:hypothetical protein
MSVNDGGLSARIAGSENHVIELLLEIAGAVCCGAPL